MEENEFKQLPPDVFERKFYFTEHPDTIKERQASHAASMTPSENPLLRLTSMPTEVLAHIIAMTCEDDSYDLMNTFMSGQDDVLKKTRETIGLTCRRIRDVVLRHVFKVASLRFSERSYQKLEKLAASPYRHYVKVFEYEARPFFTGPTVDIARFADIFMDNEVGIPFYRTRDTRHLPCDLSIPEDCARITAQILEDSAPERALASKNQSSRYSTGLRLAGILSAFANLEAVKFTCNPFFYGMKMQMLPENEIRQSWLEHHKHFMTSLGMRSERKDCVPIQHMNYNGLCPLPGAILTGDEFHMTILAFQNLRRLRLSTSWRGDLVMLSCLSSIEDNFALVLPAAQSIEVLQLVNDEGRLGGHPITMDDESFKLSRWVNETGFFSVIGGISFPLLADLTLSEWYIDMQTFGKFATQHKTTLKRLKLSNIQFVQPWRSQVGNCGYPVPLDLTFAPDKIIAETTFAKIGNECTGLNEIYLGGLFPLGDYGDYRIQDEPENIMWFQGNVFQDVEDISDLENTWNPDKIRGIYAGWCTLLTGARAEATWNIYPEKWRENEPDDSLYQSRRRSKSDDDDSEEGGKDMYENGQEEEEEEALED